MITYWKSIILFEIKLALILKKKLVANLFTKIFLKTKIKSYGDEATDFHDKEIPKVASDYTCLAVITIGSTLKKDENYYLQGFLKECKYIEKEVIKYITGDPEISSDKSDEE